MSPFEAVFVAVAVPTVLMASVAGTAWTLRRFSTTLESLARVAERQNEQIAILRRQHESLRKEFDAYASASEVDMAATLRAVAAVLNKEADEYDPPKV